MSSTGVLARAVTSNVFDTHTHNLDTLLEAYRTSKIEKRGLLTVMNHTSVLDDPLTWGPLPFDNLLYPHRMRWTLGAENICFKNSFLGWFFSLGQVLSTKRFGAGPFQPSIDAAIALLSRENAGEELHYSIRARQSPPSSTAVATTATGGRHPQWVHTFPESVVHQPHSPFDNTLRYFKWGVSRLVLEPTVPPVIVPVYIQGLDKVMPEDGTILKSSSIGAKLDIAFGDPIDDTVVQGLRQQWVDLTAPPDGTSISDDMPEEIRTGPQANELRKKTAEVIRDSVLRVRSAAFPELPEDQTRFKNAEFWKLDNPDRDVKVRTNGKVAK